METLRTRINEIQRMTSRSVRDFARTIGCKQVTVMRQLNGESAISMETVLGILRTFPEISAEWLLRGDGEQKKAVVPENKGGKDDILKALLRLEEQNMALVKELMKDK